MTPAAVVYAARGHRWRARPGRAPLHLATCPCWRQPPLPARRRWWLR